MQAATRISPLAFSYLRFSSPAQAEGDSVRRQTALRDGWLKRHDHVRLDTSLSLIDAGVSGFRGEHRTNRKHALASFLDLVERGRVPAGSYLIVENLDRLSREHPLEVLGLVGDLVRAGIQVVQLAPEVVFTADMDEGTLCMLLLGAIRGHGESQRKSGMCGAAWTEKKDEARMARKAHGKAVPAWLELDDGTYRVRQDAGRAVRLIFQWCAEGLGTLAITQRLNAEGIPPIARGRRWIRSYVAKIIDNRAVLGEYQPMKGHRGRVVDGEPITDYFPAVVSEQQWFAAHAAVQARNKRCGRPGKKGTFTFPFSGMLRDAQDRCPVHVITRKGKRYLVSANAALGERGSHWCPFPLEPFTEGVLSKLHELRASDLFAEPGGARIAELTGRIADVEKKLAVAIQRFEADPESPTWADRVSKYDHEKRTLANELADARQEAATPRSGAWAEAVALMAENEPERLRAALLATIESVWCLFLKIGTGRVAAVQVHFHGGTSRSYLIRWSPRAKPYPVDTFAEVMPGDALDLRKRDHARRLEKVLAAVEVETW